MHGESEQRGENANFDHDPQNGGRGSFAHRRMRIGAAGIELHHAGGVGDRFDAGKRQHDADEACPVLPEAAVQRLQISDRFADVRKTEKSEHYDDDRCRDRNQKGETAGVFRSKQIEHADDKDGRGGELLGCGTPRY